MDWVKLAKISLICTAVAGCASSSSEIEWRPYKDIDGSIQHMSFQILEQVSLQNQQKQIIYRAYKAERFGDIQLQKHLGDISALAKNHQNYAMAAIFLLHGKSIDLADQTAISQLAQAKQFDLYEFGQFRLSHAQFQAKNAICQDFNGKNGVDLIMTGNYYPQNSFTDFATSLINVNLQAQSPPQQIGYTPSFSGQDAALQQLLRDDEKKMGKKIALANVKEKGSLLFNIICKKG